MLNDKVGHEDEDNSWMLTVHTFFIEAIRFDPPAKGFLLTL